MAASTELKSARDLVFQGMGRNLIHFQRLELMLKHILGRYRGSIAVGTKVCDVTQRQTVVEKKTLGLLAGELFEELIVKQSNDEKCHAPKFDPNKISYRVSIEVTEENHAARQARLNGLIEERNQMVHTSLLTMDLLTIEGCQAAVQRLDEQRARIQAEFEQAASYNDGMTLTAKQHIVNLSDPEFLKKLGFPQRDIDELNLGQGRVL